MRSAVLTGVVIGMILLAGCTPASGSGRVSMQLATDVQRRDQLASLEVEIATAGIHTAGHPITAAWINWQAKPERVDLMSLGPNETLDLGSGEVPAGNYDRVRIVVEAGHAVSADGKPTPLTLNVEPIALPVVLKNGQHIEVVIELIAIARPDGSYHLFTKSATMR
ncbi:MAG: DUF4382 domain-containing protein [Chloroflexi bacterium]|nr:MAG: DUF4382 domain-containing protein [Chloroflexota bacterium]